MKAAYDNRGSNHYQTSISSPDKQQYVLAFVESLNANEGKPLKSPKGLWSDLNLTVSEAEIAEVRQEL